MGVVATFGKMVSKRMDAAGPEAARRLLLTGYAAQQFKLDHITNKALPPSRNYVAALVMRFVRTALKHPEKAAAVSLFTPCEPLQVAGVTPYSVELLSAFLSGTKCEQTFLNAAGQAGFPETMCSYHRTFLGALESGLAPAPGFAVYTSLACDGNLITFPEIERKLGIDTFLVDVPYERSPESVAYVACQLRDMTAFVSEKTGVAITEEALGERVACAGKTAAAYERFVNQTATRNLANDMTSEMYAFLLNHVMLGSPEALRFAEMLEADIAKAPESSALKLVWLHLIPNMLEPVKTRLNHNDRAYITTCDLTSDVFAYDYDPEHPFESMANRLVYSTLNGSVDLRVERALDLVRRTGADGVVLFAHWGCKGTIGATTLIKEALEREGVPCMVLDGDGCDRSNTSEGQVATRLDAYLEMLERLRADREVGEVQP